MKEDAFLLKVNLFINRVKTQLLFFASIFILTSLINLPYSIAQSTTDIDSISSEMCKTLLLSKETTDSSRIIEMYSKHLSNFVLSLSRKEIDSVIKIFYFRLQRNCSEFKHLIARKNATKGDWKEIFTKPRISMNSKDCKEFFKRKRYKYREYNGDTTILIIDNGYWTDRFKDGSYAKGKFYFTQNCEIEFEFLESNNEIRKNYSRIGDRYRYSLLEQHNNYYLVLVETVPETRMMTFKLYYD